ncbi:type II toxin-antitoxin system VapC family toxin [Cellulomonas hominis]|uniref:type II toxin-antitoxin system VapC family toxin n=1 Tax=Cellulomonas hominis TaxID=156981 RepID=UPI001B8EA014|nr:type II toxin-antitoxin system VapC family toxin [Cellulomonas hominis]VTR76692.1 Toxin FitB [Cellulomonas hominis]
MIVLDTNVLSEPMRLSPDDRVIAWLDQVTEAVGVTAVSVGELLVGVRCLPAGRRRDGLMTAVQDVVQRFRDDVLPYDTEAARRYASLQEQRLAAGRPLSTEDGMIAAICSARNATLATRNTRDFEGLGLRLVNPWDASTPDSPPF